MTPIKYIFSLLFIVLFVIVTGCGEDSPQPVNDPLNDQLTLLKNDGKGWAATGSSAVIKDGFDVTDQFAGFELNFGDFTFSTINSLPSAWPASGTWEFTDGNQTSITRSDGVVVKTDLSGNALTLTFTSTGNPGGRTKSIDGEFQFKLTSR